MKEHKNGLLKSTYYPRIIIGEDRFFFFPSHVSQKKGKKGSKTKSVYKYTLILPGRVTVTREQLSVLLKRRSPYPENVTVTRATQ